MVKCICTSGLHGHEPGACQSEGLAPDVLCQKCNVQQAAEKVTAVSNGGFFSNATATISSVILQPFGNSYVEIKSPEQATTTHSVEAPGTGGGLMHWRTTDAARRSSGPEKPVLVPVDSSFRLILYIVLAVSILAIIAAAVAAQFWTTPTPNQQRVFEALEWAYKLGIGAIIGLISGQAARKP